MSARPTSVPHTSVQLENLVIASLVLRRSFRNSPPRLLVSHLTVRPARLTDPLTALPVRPVLLMGLRVCRRWGRLPGCRRLVVRA